MTDFEETTHQDALSPAEAADVAARFATLFDGLAELGTDPDGGWTRLAWTPQDAEARAWFDACAGELGLVTSVDRNGNQWAWTADPAAGGALVTGSHLDTVRRGGRFDGALGVVTGLLAAHVLRTRGVTVPIGVVAFADEEGGRCNTPMLGSRLLAGAVEPAAVLDRRDEDGIALRDAMAAAGVDPAGLGADPGLLARIAAYVEVHVEQGRNLEDTDAAIAVATAVLPHGRWRVDLEGEANHGGTTPPADRRDPMPVLAAIITEGREAALEHGATVTIGRVVVSPNSANSVPEHVAVSVDVRGEREQEIEWIVERIVARARAVAAEHGVGVDVARESYLPRVGFSPELRRVIADALRDAGIATIELGTAAGHDAAALAPHVPAAMLFVRNPTGVSHSPAEFARREDCLTGVAALVATLQRLTERGAA